MSEIRRKIQLKKPNPLFEAWLEDWWREAKRIESPDFIKFENALTSLRKYPLVLCSGKECLILEHFDAALCIKLDRKLSEHRKAATGNGCDSETIVGRKRLDFAVESSSQKDVKDGQKSPKRRRTYLPKFRSAGFALLITLYKRRDERGMSKAELLQASQPLSDTSMTKGQNNSFYTGWSSMSQLISKNLVTKYSHPPKFKLTSEGMELAHRLLELHPCDDFTVEEPPASSLVSTEDILAPGKPRSKQAKVTSSNSPPAASIPEPDESEIPGYFLPNSFDIILLVDTAETAGAQKVMQDETVRHLGRHSVVFEVRRLKIGDFLWVARHRETSSELVLPYILERKRLDDFAKSIKDGRFHEQKFRLKSCGLSKVIYMIEGMGSREYYGLPVSTLMQASTNTQITDDFSLKFTPNHAESMKYIANLTKLFIELFENKTLFPYFGDAETPQLDLNDFVICLYTFQSFCHNKGKSRNFEQKEIFLKSLVQLNGVSPEKALVIAENYSSPYILRKAFLSSGELLLADLTLGATGQRIGPAISKTLYHFYTLQNFPE